MWKVLIVFTIFSIFIPTISGVYFETGEGIEERGCVVPSVLANLNKNFINDFAPEGGFYLPFQNKLQALFIGQAILGREMTSQVEVSKYCPRLHWRNEEGTGKSTGYFSGFEGNQTSLTCQNSDAFGDKRSCVIKHKNGFGGGDNIHITLTDQTTYFVVLICTLNSKMWHVVSTKPKLEENVTAKISAHVQELGFDSKNFNTVDFSMC